MNLAKIRTNVSALPVSQEPSRAFMIVLFIVAIGVGAAIAYLGITGAIGGPIP